VFRDKVLRTEAVLTKGDGGHFTSAYNTVHEPVAAELTQPAVDEIKTGLPTLFFVTVAKVSTRTRETINETKEREIRTQ
jgi:hypothetical protein